MDKQSFSVICTVPVQENTINYLENTLFGIREALQATNSNLVVCDALMQDSCQALTLKTAKDSSTQTTISEQVRPVENPCLARVTNSGCQTTPELTSSYVQTHAPVENASHARKLQNTQNSFVPRLKSKKKIYKNEAYTTKVIRKLKRALANKKKVCLKAATKSFRLKLSALRLGCLALSIECGYQEMLMDLGILLQQLLVVHGYTSTILSLSSMAEMGNWYYKIRQLCQEAIKSGLQKQNGDSKEYISFELPKYVQHGEHCCTDSYNKDLVFSKVGLSSLENTVDHIILLSSEENQLDRNSEDNNYKLYFCKDYDQLLLETNHSDVKGSDSCTSTYTSILLNNQVAEVCSTTHNKNAPNLKRKGKCHKCCDASVPTCVNVSICSLYHTGHTQSEYILEPTAVSNSSDAYPQQDFSDKSKSQKGSTSIGHIPDVGSESLTNENDRKCQHHIFAQYTHIINKPDDITEIDDQTLTSIPSCSLNSSFGMNQIDRSIQDGLLNHERLSNSNGDQCLLQRFDKIFNELKNNILKDCG